MSVKTITTDELRHMKGKEGLILQGCGSDLDEWVDGINDMLTQDGILLGGSRFQNCSTFEHDGLTCLLFPFDDVKLDLGKLAIWRLRTHENFGGIWLSYYVPIHLGGFMDAGATGRQEQKKPDCPLIGQDGNIFNLMGIASRTLRENGMPDQAKEMCERIHASGSYGEALNIIGDYVNITSIDDMGEDCEEGMGIRL